MSGCGWGSGQAMCDSSAGYCVVNTANGGGLHDRTSVLANLLFFRIWCYLYVLATLSLFFCFCCVQYATRPPLYTTVCPSPCLSPNKLALRAKNKHLVIRQLFNVFFAIQPKNLSSPVSAPKFVGSRKNFDTVM